MYLSLISRKCLVNCKEVEHGLHITSSERHFEDVLRCYHYFLTYSAVMLSSMIGSACKHHAAAIRRGSFDLNVFLRQICWESRRLAFMTSVDDDERVGMG